MFGPSHTKIALGGMPSLSHNRWQHERGSNMICASSMDPDGHSQPLTQGRWRFLAFEGFRLLHPGLKWLCSEQEETSAWPHASCVARFGRPHGAAAGGSFHRPAAHFRPESQHAGAAGSGGRVRRFGRRRQQVAQAGWRAALGCYSCGASCLSQAGETAVMVPGSLFCEAVLLEQHY